MDFSQSAGGGGSGPTARSAAVAWELRHTYRSSFRRTCQSFMS